jgi:hypothetical protein
VVSVGIAVEQVEVPPGTFLAGFAARAEPSRGVIDPVTARAIAFDDVAIVALDVCALHESTCSRVQTATAGLGVDCVVTATHTHSGPACARGRVGPDQPEIERAVAEAASRAVSAARDREQPCTLEFGQARGTGIAHDRRAGLPVDPPISALVARRLDGTVLARLVEFPCHPVVMDASNLDVSGDYPAFLRTDLDADGGLTIFVTGCAGDINTGHSVEEAYTPGNSSRRTSHEAARIGRVLANAVRAADMTPVPEERVHHARVAVELPVDVRSRESLERERFDLLAERTAVVRTSLADSTSVLTSLDTWISWIDRALRDDNPSHAWAGSVHAIALGPILIVSLPGEPFLATSRQITERISSNAPDSIHHVMVLGYADGVPGYVPPSEAFGSGGYEVDQAYKYYAMPGPFAPGGAEILVDAAISAVQALDPRRTVDSA